MWSDGLSQNLSDGVQFESDEFNRKAFVSNTLKAHEHHFNTDRIHAE